MIILSKLTLNLISLLKSFDGMSYILEVQEDDNGDQFIVFPDELMEELGWEEGDVLDWQIKGDGFVLTRINDPSGYEVVEE